MEVYLSCSHSKTSVVCAFPCLLNLSPTDLGWIVSLLVVSILTSTYEDQFQIIPRKLLRRCNLADYTERGGLLDSRKELRTMSPKSQLQWKQLSGMCFCFGNHIFWHQDCWRAETASWSWTWRYHPWNHEWSGMRDWRRCCRDPENSGSNKQFFVSIKHYFFFLRL